MLVLQLWCNPIHHILHPNYPYTFGHQNNNSMNYLLPEKIRCCIRIDNYCCLNDVCCHMSERRCCLTGIIDIRCCSRRYTYICWYRSDRLYIRCGLLLVPPSKYIPSPRRYCKYMCLHPTYWHYMPRKYCHCCTIDIRYCSCRICIYCHLMHTDCSRCGLMPALPSRYIRLLRMFGIDHLLMLVFPHYCIIV